MGYFGVSILSEGGREAQDLAQNPPGTELCSCPAPPGVVAAAPRPSSPHSLLWCTVTAQQRGNPGGPDAAPQAGRDVSESAVRPQLARG